MSGNRDRGVSTCSSGSEPSGTSAGGPPVVRRRTYMRLPFSAAVALTAALSATGAGIGAAGKRSSIPPVRITFLDRAGDGIKSDGVDLGVYENRVGAVRAYIDRDTGVLTLRTG